MPQNETEYLIIGDAGVGKSSLVQAFTSETATGMHVSHTVTVDDKPLTLKIWDSVDITRSHYRAASAALLVYDITRRETFEHLPTWLEDIQQHNKSTITIVLIGNKSDLAGTRMVSTEEGEQFAKDHGLLFIETSAKAAHNVKEAFMVTAEAVKGKVQPSVPAKPDLAFEGVAATATTTVDLDAYARQMRRVVSGTPPGIGGVYRGCKPVICLFPSKPTRVGLSLKLSPAQSLTTLVPAPAKLSKNRAEAAWEVMVQPDGTLEDLVSGRRYSYIFWESEPAGHEQQRGGVESDDDVMVAAPGTPGGYAPPSPMAPASVDLGAFDPAFDPASCFCVPGNKTEDFLYETLKAMGFPVREATDMLTYWLPLMETAPFNRIAFLTAEAYEAAAALTMTPKPDHIVRVFMVFENLDCAVDGFGTVAGAVAAVKGPFCRKGRDMEVLEWGGMRVGRA